MSSMPSGIVSVPVTPPVPDAEQYAVSAAQIFRRFTRAEFAAYFNTQAPPWDKKSPIKRWFDTSVANLPADAKVNYKVFDEASGTFRVLTLTAAEASMINLPGAYTYPKYQVLPTPALVVNTITGTTSPINPAYLSFHDEVKALAEALGGYTVSEGRLEGPWAFQWNGEPRRMWNVTSSSGAVHNAASLLALRHHAGVDAPGWWDLSGGEPRWVSEIPTDTGEYDPRPEVPIPVRDLLPHEVLAQTFGGIWVIRSTNMLGPDQMMKEILALVRQIYFKLS